MESYFIPMLCEDFFPSHRVVGDTEAYEEERRVFYVSLTRAKDLLYLITPALVYSYRGPQTTRISQFISELKPQVYKKSSVQFRSPHKFRQKKEKTTNKPYPLFTSAADLLKDKD